MELHEVLRNNIVRLPKKQSTEDNFHQFIKTLFNNYIELVESCNFPSDLNKKDCVQQIKSLIAGIDNSLKAYHHGKPFNAYLKLRDALRPIEDNTWTGVRFPSKFNFYRLRIKESNYPLSQGELFHIPFHLRGKVETQRYSIPGFPSLYLSNSVYVAWEELRRPKFENIQGARLSNKEEMICLDLTTKRYLGDYMFEGDSKKLFNDVFIWPLIASCCIKIKSKEDSFKPEYIIPQLLLQWIRNNQRHWKGIMFSSTHVDLTEMNAEGDFFNVVIPVLENSEKDFCKKTSALFTMTDVLSWQLKYFSMGAAGVTTQYSGAENINFGVNRIELIKNKSFPYDFSPLADFEMTLNTMKLFNIDF